MNDRTALVLVDVQVNMFDPAHPVRDAGPLLERLARLLAAARAARRPVVFVRNCGGADDPDARGTPGWALHPTLAVSSGDIVVDKTTTNAFASTALHDALRDRGVGRLVVAGVQSEFCVHDTTCGALALGYGVTLVEDGHGTYDGRERTAEALATDVNAGLRDRVTLCRARDVVFT